MKSFFFFSLVLAFNRPSPKSTQVKLEFLKTFDQYMKTNPRTSLNIKILYFKSFLFIIFIKSFFELVNL